MGRLLLAILVVTAVIAACSREPVATRPSGAPCSPAMSGSSMSDADVAALRKGCEGQARAAAAGRTLAAQVGEQCPGVPALDVYRKAIAGE